MTTAVGIPCQLGHRMGAKLPVIGNMSIFHDDLKGISESLIFRRVYLVTGRGYQIR